MPARAGAERRAAPKPARASRETRPAFALSMPTQVDMEPRRSLPSGDRPAYSPGEGHKHWARPPC